MEVLVMSRSFLLSFSFLILLFSITCSGPSVTSSDSSSLNDQPLSGAKKDMERKANETLAAGTVIRASFQHALSTERNAPGDAFTMKVVDDVKVNDRVVIPIGSTIKGIVAESVRSGRVKGRAHMSLRFTELVLP